MAELDPPDLAPVRTALGELDSARAVTRLHARDASLFSDDPVVQGAIEDRLGWLDVIAEPPGASIRFRSFMRGLVDSGYRRVVLAGMGGSSLAPEVFATVFASAPDGLTLEILDSTHPAAVAAVLDRSRMNETLVIIASKSGTTEETRCFAAHAANVVPDPNHLVALTDPGSALEAEAFAGRWRDVFLNPADIGGRFSALSYFGMLPAALAGVPVSEVWARASAMAGRCAPDRAIDDNPSAVLGAFMAGLAREGRDKLTLLMHPRIASLGDWIEQLVAESTGKLGSGIIPIVDEPLGTPAQYGDDRAIVEVRFEGEPVAGVDALAEAGIPRLVLDLAHAPDIGGAFLLWELATAYAGVLLRVNPFDEPNVTESKHNTASVLEEVAAGRRLPDPESDELDALLGRVKAGDYLTFQAYLPMTAETKAALQRARTLVRDRLGVATTVGFGPRFLHSTGQLHKGGPDSLVALQLVDTPRGGPDIPNRPYDFATLIRAQAVGDLQSLESRARRVTQVAVDATDLDPFVTRLEAALPD